MFVTLFLVVTFKTDMMHRKESGVLKVREFSVKCRVTPPTQLVRKKM